MHKGSRHHVGKVVRHYNGWHNTQDAGGASDDEIVTAMAIRRRVNRVGARFAPCSAVS
jgi:hypothetical protein